MSVEKSRPSRQTQVQNKKNYFTFVMIWPFICVFFVQFLDEPVWKCPLLSAVAFRDKDSAVIVSEPHTVRAERGFPPHTPTICVCGKSSLPSLPPVFLSRLLQDRERKPSRVEN